MSIKSKKSRQKVRRWHFVVKAQTPDGMNKYIDMSMTLGDQAAAHDRAEEIRVEKQAAYGPDTIISVEAVGNETVTQLIVDKLIDYQANIDILLMAMNKIAVAWSSGSVPPEGGPQKIMVEALQAVRADVSAPPTGDVQLTDIPEVEEASVPFVPEIVNPKNRIEEETSTWQT